MWSVYGRHAGTASLTGKLQKHYQAYSAGFVPLSLESLQIMSPVTLAVLMARLSEGRYMEYGHMS